MPVCVRKIPSAVIVKTPGHDDWSGNAKLSCASKPDDGFNWRNSEERFPNEGREEEGHSVAEEECHEAATQTDCIRAKPQSRRRVHENTVRCHMGDINRLEPGVPSLVHTITNTDVPGGAATVGVLGGWCLTQDST